MNVLIMHKNTPVFEFNLDTDTYILHNPQLLPFELQGKVYTELRQGFKEHVAIGRRVLDNSTAFISWLAGRTLLLSRANAKWLYNAIGIPQCEDNQTRAKIALTCRALSILDSYWVKLDNDDVTWEDIDVRHVSLNEAVTQIALHGESLTLQGSLTTPEFSTNGAYAKGWRRHSDGNLWLHKLGHDGVTESKIEVMCSNLLDCMNVEHVHYEIGTDNGKTVCMCPCISSDSVSIISFLNFASYCDRMDLNPTSEVIRLDADAYYKMTIVDYLIANRDRHGENWGLWYNTDTMQLKGLHPLFDHNNAFDLKSMQNPDEKYQVTGKSLRESAKYAMTKVDFHFTAPITRDLFITERQYKCFTERARELGIQTLVDEKPLPATPKVGDDAKEIWTEYVKRYCIADQRKELVRLKGLYNTSTMSDLMKHIKIDFLS